MTSEVDSLQTNEFLQRRKLRLQQVREQSKDIAKKIRQRAKVETLRQVKEVDTKKEKEYLECQKNFVNRLQEIYTSGLHNLGAGHKKASQHLEQDDDQKPDKSRLRGKEAVAAERRKKQEVLDRKKQLLDRKLQARVAANELSREKSSTVVKNLLISAKDSDVVPDNKAVNDPQNSKVTHDTIRKVDMATQSNLDEPSSECQADIPLLELQPENESRREGTNDVGEKSGKSKRPNLFALSDEMPSSLRGGLSSVPQEVVHMKPSLTLVSEYLQNRKLRLREIDTKSNKRQIEDLKNIKQTILRTRASKTEDSAVTRKSSVMMYNHATRDIRTLPFNNESIVVRDHISDDDAYSKAEKEEKNDDLKEKELQDKIAERRNKIAITKENVDKEYRDTLAFLNSLPKDMTNKPIKKAYMDENRQQELKEKQQLKLQQEFNNIEKEHRRRNCKHAKSHIHKQKSPYCEKQDSISKDCHEYSWMPVPEKEGNLAVHTIPTSVNNKRHGNTVRFGESDTYHEYRSRHKHTPPTKDIPNPRKLTKNKYIETVLIEQSSNDSTDCSSISSDSTSLESLVLNKTGKQNKRDESSEEFDPKLSDADRIVIYKILNSKHDKKKKIHSKMTERSRKISQPIQDINVDKCSDYSNSKKNKPNVKSTDQTDTNDNAMNNVTNQQFSEGIYKAVSENMDNVTSLHFSENAAAAECVHAEAENKNSHRCCLCTKDNNKGTTPSTGSCFLERPAMKCDCTRTSNNSKVPPQTICTTPLKSSASDKTGTVPRQSGFIKIMEDGVQENGKIYVGASGFLKDEAYEVIIQLRKKEFTVKDGEISKNQDLVADKSTVKQFENNTNLQNATDEVVTNDNEGKESELKDNEKQFGDPIQVTSNELPKSPIKLRNNQGATETDSIHTEDKQISELEKKTHVCPDSKKATSTYTQTTNSPIQRPVFMHMSSSTSTTYMSPPENILPRFFRRDSYLSCDETYDSIIANKSQNVQSYKDKKYCWCKHQVSTRKRSSCPNNVLKDHRKENYEFKKFVTPPNTACSTDIESVYSKNKFETCSETVKPRIRNACDKCEKHKHKCTKHINRNKHGNHTYKHSPTLPEVSSSASNKHIRIVKSNLSKRIPKNPLNPIIKQYVNKLLELNKEGMKAVEIINEECSSVQTPSSSIINDSLNINGKISQKQTISLEQIKNSMKEKIISDHNLKENENKRKSSNFTTTIINKNFKIYPKLSQRKQQHKIKSLNISRKISKTKKKSGCPKFPAQPYRQNSSSSSIKYDQSFFLPPKISKHRRKSHNLPRENISSVNETERTGSSLNIKKTSETSTLKSLHRSMRTPVSTDSENIRTLHNNQNKLECLPAHISTQTSGTFDSDTNYMKVAEGKLQNMEKIADLTEKCTKRLSNLAKVLEEVRRHKSLAYSQMTASDSTSDSDLERTKKNSAVKTPTPPLVQLNTEIQNSFDKMSSQTPGSDEEKEKKIIDINTFVPLLTDIPKPTNFKAPLPPTFVNSAGPPNDENNINSESSHIKQRGKPPPALSRIHLKNDEHIIPHELSTVLEVDSPMSLKLKSRSRQDVSDNISNSSNKSVDDIHARGDNNNGTREIKPVICTGPINPDLLQNKANINMKSTKTLGVDSADDSKLQMMDMKQFNEIMLKPFISINEYAKKHNVVNPEESNGDDHVKNALTGDDLSSFHSESSLPDVIAELLKRKIISEPFKFDTASNVNSSTISSESSVSLLALSNTRKEKKEPHKLLQNLKNISETSDTLSISSNPDLENAFKKLGMGWASSTLKKTKERLALSSSSNTSSSSGIQLKGKIRNNPELNSDSISSLINIKSPRQGQNATESSKNAEQQTSMSNSMTVKEFLTNELAKRITFSNKSTKNLTDQEFISLYETKMPEEMKQVVREDDQSNNSLANCTNNRARTSTPVQIFRSMTYHSTSSSNTSNGLFSNVDELSSVKVTSNSMQNHSTSDKDDLTIPKYILKTSKRQSDYSKSD